MARRVLESLRGVGEIHTGDLLLRQTHYEIFLWVDDGTGGPLQPAKSVNIDGHIDIAGVGEAVVLAGPGDLTLRLEDGRRLAFVLTSTLGSIAGRGGLQPA